MPDNYWNDGFSRGTSTDEDSNRSAWWQEQEDKNTFLNEEGSGWMDDGESSHTATDSDADDDLNYLNDFDDLPLVSVERLPSEEEARQRLQRDMEEQRAEADRVKRQQEAANLRREKWIVENEPLENVVVKDPNRHYDRFGLVPPTFEEKRELSYGERMLALMGMVAVGFVFMMILYAQFFSP